jgi:hypothetical protein
MRPRVIAAMVPNLGLGLGVLRPILNVLFTNTCFVTAFPEEFAGFVNYYTSPGKDVVAFKPLQLK